MTGKEERLKARVYLWSNRDGLNAFTVWHLQHHAKKAGWWFDSRLNKAELARQIRKRLEEWHDAGGPDT